MLQDDAQPIAESAESQWASRDMSLCSGTCRGSWPAGFLLVMSSVLVRPLVVAGGHWPLRSDLGRPRNGLTSARSPPNETRARVPRRTPTGLSYLAMPSTRAGGAGGSVAVRPWMRASSSRALGSGAIDGCRVGQAAAEGCWGSSVVAVVAVLRCCTATAGLLPLPRCCRSQRRPSEEEVCAALGKLSEAIGGGPAG